MIQQVNNRDELPDHEDILTGKPYEIPQTIDAQYVLMASLIRALLSKVADDRINGFFNYVAQFEESRFSDYGVVLVKETFDAFTQMDRQKEFTKHPAFDAWLGRNADAMR